MYSLIEPDLYFQDVWVNNILKSEKSVGVSCQKNVTQVIGREICPPVILQSHPFISEILNVTPSRSACIFNLPHAIMKMFYIHA